MIAGSAAVDEVRDWTFSPHPVVELAITRVLQKHPMMLQEGTPRAQAFLEKLGHPQKHLPPVFHVAGTNGKGSTLAFLQALFEAAGKTVHKYTSPHLVRFEERIVLAGQQISPEKLLSLIAHCEEKAGDDPLSFFEFFTGLAFFAFAQEKADAVLLETGLGGLHDATNCIDVSEVAIITRLSMDHQKILGATLAEITLQKAGILRRHGRAVFAPQAQPQALETLQQEAQKKNANVFSGWQVTSTQAGFVYKSGNVELALPCPALLGAHQIENAGVALAALECSRFSALLTQDNAARAMQNVFWPARMQRLVRGPLVALLPEGGELWLDGAHNDSGAEVLAAHVRGWGNEKPAHLVTAYKAGKDARGFYEPLKGVFASLQVVDEKTGAPMAGAAGLVEILRSIGYENPQTASGLQDAVSRIVFTSSKPARIIIAGSLYLAGRVLRTHS